MNVKIQLSDEAYKTLVNGNGRLEGSLGLVSPTEGNFNAYRRSASRPGTWTRAGRRATLWIACSTPSSEKLSIIHYQLSIKCNEIRNKQ